MTEEEREAYMDKLDAEARQGQAGSGPSSGSAAFLRIIQLCEDYQNADIEGHDSDRIEADADRRICEILKVAADAYAFSPERVRLPLGTGDRPLQYEPSSGCCGALIVRAGDLDGWMCSKCCQPADRAYPPRSAKPSNDPR